MIQNATSPPAGEAGEPGVVSCATPDSLGILQNGAAAQSPITEIERDFRRYEVLDAGAECVNYLIALRAMIASDDLPGLRYCATEFVSYARIVATGCKALLGGGGTVTSLRLLKPPSAPPGPRIAVRIVVTRDRRPHGRSRAFRLSEEQLAELLAHAEHIERRGR